ncbi:MAG: hypothetical protein LBF58_08355 [Deltaproteobacteria bacterium]|nr:hypothetical protein [Deltaproteobacteria bacterium]
MTQNPSRQKLLTDLYAALAYAGGVGLSELMPKIPAKKLPLAGPGPAPDGYRPDPRPAPRTQVRPAPGTERPKPPAWAHRAGPTRQGPDEIMAQAGYEPLPRARAAGQAPARARRACKEPPRLPSLDLSWIGKANSLGELNAGLDSCRNCLLSQDRVATVPGRGPVGAPIFFVLDTPPAEAAEGRRIPLGAEAELFENVVTKGLKLTLDDVYVTPLSKCPVPDPSNYPETFPMKACSHILFREIELVGPKAVVTLGERPAKILSGLEKSHFVFLRNENFLIGRAKKVPMKATYDLPTIIELIEAKREFWNDLKQVLKII